MSGVFTVQEIQWTERNKSEGICASLDLFFTEQLVQEMLIASHWSMLVHGRIDFNFASSFVPALPVPYRMPEKAT